MAQERTPDAEAPREWHLYMVETVGGALYTGISTDVERRIAQHESGRGARALRGKGPLELRHAECVGGHGDALRLEAKVKRLTAAAKRRWLAEKRALGSQRKTLPAEPEGDA